MIENYFKIAFRTFVKEKFYALINVLGLSLGIASSLLIGMYILHEASYDDFHPGTGEFSKLWPDIDVVTEIFITQ